MDIDYITDREKICTWCGASSKLVKLEEVSGAVTLIYQCTKHEHHIDNVTFRNKSPLTQKLYDMLPEEAFDNNISVEINSSEFYSRMSDLPDSDPAKQAIIDALEKVPQENLPDIIERIVHSFATVMIDEEIVGDIEDYLSDILVEKDEE